MPCQPVVSFLFLSYLPNSDVIWICNFIYANDSVLTPFILITFCGLKKKKTAGGAWRFRKAVRRDDKWLWPNVIPETWEAALSLSAVPWHVRKCSLSNCSVHGPTSDVWVSCDRRWWAGGGCDTSGLPSILLSGESRVTSYFMDPRRTFPDLCVFSDFLWLGPWTGSWT